MFVVPLKRFKNPVSPMSLDPSLGIDIENDFDRHVGDADYYLQQLRYIKRLDENMRQHGQVDRCTMQTLESIAPQCIDANYPINGFTRTPSSQNLAVALESNYSAQYALTLMSSGSLGRALYFWIRMFHKSQIDEKLKTIEEGQRTLLANQQNQQQMIEQSQNNDVSWSEDQLIEQVKQKITATYPSQDDVAQRFVIDHRVGGYVYQTIVDNGQRLVRYLEQFQNRISELDAFIDQLQQRSQPITERTIRRMKRWVVDQTDSFVKSMQQLNEYAIVYQDENGYRSYFKDQVRGTQAFALQALSYPDQDFDVQNLVPYRLSSIQKIIDEIATQAQSIIDKKDRLEEQDHRRKSTTTQDRQSNREALEQETKQAFDQTLHDVQQSIRYEIESLRIYQNTLSLLLDFHIALFNQSLENQRLQQTLLQQV